MLYTRRVTYGQSFLIFSCSNINSRQNGVRMYPSSDVTFISALMNYSFMLYVKSSIEFHYVPRSPMALPWESCDIPEAAQRAASSKGLFMLDPRSEFNAHSRLVWRCRPFAQRGRVWSHSNTLVCSGEMQLTCCIRCGSNDRLYKQPSTCRNTVYAIYLVFHYGYISGETTS